MAICFLKEEKSRDIENKQPLLFRDLLKNNITVLKFLELIILQTETFISGEANDEEVLGDKIEIWCEKLQIKICTLCQGKNIAKSNDMTNAFFHK